MVNLHTTYEPRYYIDHRVKPLGGAINQCRFRPPWWRGEVTSYMSINTHVDHSIIYCSYLPEATCESHSVQW